MKLEFDKQTYDVRLTEILETFPRVFSFRKLRVKENGGKRVSTVCKHGKSTLLLK